MFTNSFSTIIAGQRGLADNLPDMYGRNLWGEISWVTVYEGPTEADVVAQVALDLRALQGEFDEVTHTILHSVEVADGGPAYNEYAVRSDVLYRLCPQQSVVTDDEYLSRVDPDADLIRIEADYDDDYPENDPYTVDEPAECPGCPSCGYPDEDEESSPMVEFALAVVRAAVNAGLISIVDEDAEID